MTDFNFYSETYCGSLIPADAWDAVCRDAEAQMNRYERIYHVSYPQTGSRNMAVCAMAEALYEFAQLQDAGGAVQSLEQALDFIDTDELLEVTPESLRIRKKILDPTMRKRASFKK